MGAHVKPHPQTSQFRPGWFVIQLSEWHGSIGMAAPPLNNFVIF
jgi:hypothetical protein